jgi:hypothetical protein
LWDNSASSKAERVSDEKMAFADAGKHRERLHLTMVTAMGQLRHLE